jgi:hypothetical protein
MLALKFCHRPFPQSSSSRVTADASDDVAEVRGLGFPGAWVKHSPPKRLRSASAVAASGRDLVEAFVNALGGEQACSELTMVAVRRAVELTVTAEMTRAAVLTGSLKGLVIADLIKLENAARRAQAGLGLKIEPAKTAPRGLQRARERWAAQEQQAKAAQTAREAAQNNITTEQPPDGTAE